jgi:hypothetical protein
MSKSRQNSGYGLSMLGNGFVQVNDKFPKRSGPEIQGFRAILREGFSEQVA